MILGEFANSLCGNLDKYIKSITVEAQKELKTSALNQIS